MEREVVGTGFWSDLSFTQLIVPFLFCHLLSMITGLSSRATNTSRIGKVRESCWGR